MKILIIRLSSIGDIVLTTPVIRCVKQQILNAEVHFLVKPQFRDLLKSNPYIDKLHSLKESLTDTIVQLKKEKFDCVIDLHRNQRTFVIKKFLQTQHHSFDKQNIAKWLLVNFKFNGLPQLHVVDRYMKTVSSLGVENDGKGLDYFIPESEQIGLEHLPHAHRAGYIGWVTGAAHQTKKFPADKIIRICRSINFPVVLLGGNEEKEEGQRIAETSGTQVFNACGMFSLNGSASLVQQAKLIVTNDTGMMHLAAAFQKPVISLWGNTVPAFGMYPYYGNSGQKAEMVEVEGLNCRPCSKLGYKKCPKKHFKCMELLDESKIIELINHSVLLAEGKSK